MLTDIHYQELIASAIAPETIELNFKSIEGLTTCEYLFYSEKLSRTNTGRVAAGILKNYEHIWQGGWWCGGLDPNAYWDEMLWGCFKPDAPRTGENGKLVKYEHPLKTPTRAFYLRVTFRQGLLIARRYGYENEYLERIDQAYYAEKPEGFGDFGATNTAAFSKTENDGKANGTENTGSRSTSGVQRNNPGMGASHQWCRTTEDRGFWQWVIDNPAIAIAVTEGAKKAASLLSYGFCAIALPGIYSGYRTPKDGFGHNISNSHLIPELKVIAQKCRPIYLCFDNDTKLKTIWNVQRATKKLGWLFAHQGCNVKGITWQGEYKGVDDLIYNCGIEAFEAAYNVATDIGSYSARISSQLTYPAYKTFTRKYIGNLDIPIGAKLIGLKSAKNTGKTEAIAQLIAPRISEGLPTIVITHRVQLGEHLCSRFGINYLTELKASEEGKILGYGLCLDSLHDKGQGQFDPDNWDDALVVVDESEQVFWHGLGGGTCRKFRSLILTNLQQLFSNVMRGNGQIILSDADLSDLSIEYAQQLMGAKVEPVIFLNEYKDADQYKCFHYTDKSPAALLFFLEKAIAEGKKFILHVGAQKWKSKYSTQNLEKRWREKFPDLKLLRVDQESIADPTPHPAFGIISHLNETLEDYDVVIASPSIETGVSIDIKGHFDFVAGIFPGVQTTDAVRQALIRLREPVDRHIWIAERGLDFVGNGSSNYKSLLSSSNKVAKLDIQALERTDIADIDLEIKSDHLLTWAKFGARINLGKSSYRANALAGLREEGHDIFDCECEDDLQNLKAQMKAECERNYEDDLKAIDTQPLITDDERDKLREKRAKTPDERKLERKYDVTHRYGVETTPDLFRRDDDGWYPQIRLHYFLTIGREFLKIRDNQKYQSQKENGGIFSPDFNRSQYSSKVLTMEQLSTSSLLKEWENNPNIELRDGEGLAKDIADKVRAAGKFQIKALLDITIDDEDSDIEIVRALLDKLDIKVLRTRQERVGDKRVSIFGINPFNVDQQVVLASNPIYRQVGLDKLLEAFDNDSKLQLRNGEGLAKEIGDNVRANNPGFAKLSDIKIISTLLNPFYINVRCCQKIEHSICDLLVRLGIYDLAADWANEYKIIELRHGEGRAKEIGDRARTHSKEIKFLLGLTISQSDTDITIVSKLVGKAGIKTRRVRRERVDNKRIGIYQLVGGLDGMTDVDGEPIQHILEHHIFFDYKTEKIYCLCPASAAMGIDRRELIFQGWQTKDIEFEAELAAARVTVSTGTNEGTNSIYSRSVTAETVSQELATVGNEVDLFSLVERYGRRLCNEAAKMLKEAKNQAYGTIRAALRDLKATLGDDYQTLPA